ncbi:MAG: hypothetical protein AABN34_04490 [Acidobacteriota bacterium]
MADPEPGELSLTLTLAGHVIEQAGRLLTVIEKLHVVKILFEPSVAVQLMRVSPTGKLLPEGGLQAIVRAGQVPTVVAVV